MKRKVRTRQEYTIAGLVRLLHGIGVDIHRNTVSLAIQNGALDELVVRRPNGRGGVSQRIAFALPEDLNREGSWFQPLALRAGRRAGRQKWKLRDRLAWMDVYEFVLGFTPYADSMPNAMPMYEEVAGKDGSRTLVRRVSTVPPQPLTNEEWAHVGYARRLHGIFYTPFPQHQPIESDSEYREAARWALSLPYEEIAEFVQRMEIAANSDADFASTTDTMARILRLLSQMTNRQRTMALETMRQCRFLSRKGVAFSLRRLAKALGITHSTLLWRMKTHLLLKVIIDGYITGRRTEPMKETHAHAQGLRKTRAHQSGAIPEPEPHDLNDQDTVMDELEKNMERSKLAAYSS